MLITRRNRKEKKEIEVYMNNKLTTAWQGSAAVAYDRVSSSPHHLSGTQRRTQAALISDVIIQLTPFSPRTSSRDIHTSLTTADWLNKMEPIRRQQLIRQRALAKSALTRMQTFIESGDRKVNEIQVRFDDLQGIFDRYDTAQIELELSDDSDHSIDKQFEDQYYETKAKFTELLHPVVESHSRFNSPPGSISDQGHSVHSNNNTHIKLPTIALPTFAGDTCSWLHFRDTFEALVVNNANLSNVQRFHYLIASLKNSAKDLISNLQSTNEDFLVALQLVTQRCNNTRLIAMMHA